MKTMMFGDRRDYRRQRMYDALRIMPFLGWGLWLIPLLWPAGANEPGAPTAMSSAILYVFAVWLGLIIAVAGLWWGLRAADRAE